jgi:hypothetical protein
MNSSSDILSASSTLITVIAVLYSLWYSDIDKYSHIELPKFEADRDPLRKAIRGVKYSKVMPLLVINTFYFLIFLPESFFSFLQCLKNIDSDFSWSFDPIILSIIFMNIMSFIFVLILFNKLTVMNKKIGEKGV